MYGRDLLLHFHGRTQSEAWVIVISELYPNAQSLVTTEVTVLRQRDWRLRVIMYVEY